MDYIATGPRKQTTARHQLCIDNISMDFNECDVLISYSSEESLSTSTSLLLLSSSQMFAEHFFSLFFFFARLMR